MSYDKKLSRDTMPWPRLDYRTHSTEKANYVTLERLSYLRRKEEQSTALGIAAALAEARLAWCNRRWARISIKQLRMRS
jgi:hypothetical protein